MEGNKKMSEESHDIKDVLINVTDDNVEEKLNSHNRRVINAIKYLGLGVIKIHTRISKPSNREIQIESTVRGE